MMILGTNDVKLMKHLAALEAEIKRLQAEVTRLQVEAARLEAENAELRRRLAKDSSNSHKPPSSDGYRKNPRRKSAMPKREKRKSGEQKGHQGRTLTQVGTPTR